MTGILSSQIQCESTNIFTIWPRTPVARILRKEHIAEDEYLLEYECIEPIFFYDRGWLLAAGEKFIALYRNSRISLCLPNRPDSDQIT